MTQGPRKFVKGGEEGKAEPTPSRKPRQTPSARLPPQRTLASLAALISPFKAARAPALAVKRAARLWFCAGDALADYERLGKFAPDAISRFLASDESSATEWIAKNTFLLVGTDDNSEFLSYVNAKLPMRFHLKAVRAIPQIHVTKHPVTHAPVVAMSEADYYIATRLGFESMGKAIRRAKHR